METFEVLNTFQASHSSINETIQSRWVLLMRRWLLLYQEASVDFLRQFCIFQSSSSKARQISHPSWELDKHLILSLPISSLPSENNVPPKFLVQGLIPLERSTIKMGRSILGLLSFKAPNTTWVKNYLPTFFFL